MNEKMSEDEVIKHVVVDDGCRIGYRVLGAGPRTLVAQHGFHCTGRNFGWLLPYLPLDEWTVVLMDLRGGGLSDKPESGYTIERFSRDLLAVIEAEDLKEVTLVGHSTGGAIAQWVASELAGERLRSVVLLGPVPATGVPIPPGAANTFKEGLDDYKSSATIWRMGMLKAPEKELMDELVQDSESWDKSAYFQMFDAWTKAHFPERLAKIATPTLVVGAEGEPFLPEPFLREAVVNPIPGARWAQVPAASHFMHVEQPAFVAGVISAFDAAQGSC
jgi:pimeloyl-ACP methyl ester carboxylesterase